MTKEDIDQFFDSLPKDVLKEKWDKYSKYSKLENSVTISELLDVCGFTKADTFVAENYTETGIIQCSKCTNSFKNQQ